jgi:PEP-CTERM motif-containing protein
MKSLFQSVRVGVVAVVAVACASFATADPLPAAQGAAQANDASGLMTISHFGGVSGAGNDCNPVPIECFNDSASTGPVQVFVNGVGTYSSASAVATVFYEVVGPVANVPVPLMLTGDLFIGGADTALVSASISWNEDAGSVGISYADGVPAEGKNVDVAITTPSDVVENIGLEALGETCLFICIPDAGAWEATADPTLTIDPSFLAANPGYSLIYSPGVNLSPAPGVPEPSTWTQMLFGFAALGWKLRSRLVS